MQATVYTCAIEVSGSILKEFLMFVVCYAMMVVWSVINSVHISKFAAVFSSRLILPSITVPIIGLYMFPVRSRCRKVIEADTSFITKRAL